MTGSFQMGARGGPLAIIALLTVLLMMVAPTAAVGPLLEVTAPVDGQLLTTKLVTVSGTVSEPTYVLTLSGEDLAHATMVNVRYVDDNLVFRRTCVFEDTFDGPTLDTQKFQSKYTG